MISTPLRLLLLCLVLFPLGQAQAHADCPPLYLDRDGDGFGDPNLAVSRSSCKALPGYVFNGTDCNDFSADIYPGAPNAWWTGTVGADCSQPEPAAGPEFFVNCNFCAPGDQGCDTRHLGCSNPETGCNFSRIQDAIDAAHDGTTIEICQGIYHEQLDFAGKAITVRGRLTHGVTITGDGSGRPAVSFRKRETASSMLSRVTISAGLHPEIGGGVYIQNASPTLDQVNFIGNALYERGGALYILANAGRTSAPVIRSSSFSQNHSLNTQAGLGGAVGILSRDRGSVASPTFQDVVFAENSAMSGGAIHAAADLGGAVMPTLTRARFYHNTTTHSGSAIAVDIWDGSGALNLTNTIFEKNTGGSETVYLRSQNGRLPVKVTNSTFVGNSAAKGVIRGEAGPASGNIDLTLENDLIVFNQAIDTMVSMSAKGGRAITTGHYHYNDIYSNGYTGLAWAPTADSSHNVSVDPHFDGYSDSSQSMDDLTLNSVSPAINAGNPDATYNDAGGGRNDLGAYGGPFAIWPAFPPFIASIDIPEPDIDDMVLARRTYLELLGSAPSAVGCQEELPDGTVGESVYFSAASARTPNLDLLGLKADTSYDCYVTASNGAGMSAFAFELLTPPLPLELQDLWKLTTYDSQTVRPGYTLFNVYGTSFNPHYIVLVDLQGEVRWYYAFYDDASPIELDPFTADTAVDFIPETAQILFGGGMNLEALPHLLPLIPGDPQPLQNLGCASQQDEIHAICAGIAGNNLPDETPNHETLMTPDRKHVTYMCSEQLAKDGATPEQYCTDSDYRQMGFSVEEWDISNPTQPTNSWRWSSRQQIDRCVLPHLAGTDIFHANAIWREDTLRGAFYYVSLRHRNLVMKIDRSSSDVVWKLGPLMEEDMCPADTAPDPTQCPGFDAQASLCSSHYYPRFSLVRDTTDVTCPDDSSYAGPEEHDPQWFYGQHAPNLVKGDPDGVKTFYMHDNGRDAPDNVEDPESRDYTRALRMIVDEDKLEATVDWQYCRGTEKGASDTWWAPAWGSVNPVLKQDGTQTGHTLIASPHCTLCQRIEDSDSENTFVAEVDEDKQVLWSLDFGQSYAVYRAHRIDGCYRLPGRQDFFMGTGTYCQDIAPHTSPDSSGNPE